MILQAQLTNLRIIHLQTHLTEQKFFIGQVKTVEVLSLPLKSAPRKNPLSSEVIQERNTIAAQVFYGA